MSKPVIVDVNCPHCKKDHPTAIPIEDLNIAIGRVQHDETVKPDIADLVSKEVERKLAKPEKEEKPKKEKVVVQSFEPKYYCPDGNCEIGVHKNENYKERPTKKCDDCGNYAPKKAKKCAWCGNDGFDELDDDELAKLPQPTEREDDHDHE